MFCVILNFDDVFVVFDCLLIFKFWFLLDVGNLLVCDWFFEGFLELRICVIIGCWFFIYFVKYFMVLWWGKVLLFLIRMDESFFRMFFC